MLSSCKYPGFDYINDLDNMKQPQQMLTLCERKEANLPVFALEISKFQNIIVLVTKAKFQENKSHFLYF
jgi:hypothetical protein